LTLPPRAIAGTGSVVEDGGNESTGRADGRRTTEVRRPSYAHVAGNYSFSREPRHIWPTP